MGTQIECFHTHKADILCLCLAEDENSVYFAGKFSAAVFYTDMHRLTAGIHSEKCVVRRFRRCANVVECTYTNLDSIAYYTRRLYGVAYCC
jgi:hypothetical protein